MGEAAQVQSRDMTHVVGRALAWALALLTVLVVVVGWVLVSEHRSRLRSEASLVGARCRLGQQAVAIADLSRDAATVREIVVQVGILIGPDEPAGRRNDAKDRIAEIVNAEEAGTTPPPLSDAEVAELTRACRAADKPSRE